MAIDGYHVIRDIIPIIALVVSAVVPAGLFYLGHTRSKKSEQIRIGRECWDRIEPKYHAVRDWTLKNEDRQSSESREELRRALRLLRNELEYLVYLIENGEIRETFIREYYRKRLFDIQYIAKRIGRRNPDNSYPGTKQVLDLVKKYHELTGKLKEYEAQDSSIYP